MGTRFLVTNRINHLIIDFKHITPRICTVSMRGKFLNYSIINGLAPTEIPDDKKDGVFIVLERAYDISPRNDIKIFLVDFNAKVGKEAVNFPTVGNCILHSLTNDNGSRQIQFAVSRNMIIGSTFHPHKDFHKNTRRSPNGVTSNQIDHLLTFDTNLT
jgi:hypothetical protein